MMLRSLAAAVQHGETADLGAEMARLGRDYAQRVRGGAEQYGVDRHLVLECDGAHRRAQGEDRVKTRQGQRWSRAFCQPPHRFMVNRLMFSKVRNLQSTPYYSISAKIRKGQL